jgi:serine/threonine-protein kinase
MGSKQLLAGCTLAILLTAGYFTRPETAETASNPPKEDVGAVDTSANAKASAHDNANVAAEGKERHVGSKERTAAAANGPDLAAGPSDPTAQANAAPTTNEGKDLTAVALDSKKKSAKFDVRTPGTILALVSADERRELGDGSQPIEIDSSKSWTLEATNPGHKTLTLPLSFEDESTKTFVIALEDAEKVEHPTPAAPSEEAHVAKPTAVATKTENDTSKSATNAKVAAGETTKPSADTTKTAATEAPKTGDAKIDPKAVPPPAGKCTLNLNSIPASRINLDSHDIGMTPKVGLTVAPGTHIVMFANEGGKKVTSATCKAGEQKTVAMRLLF